jgi:hypothetical protein
MAHCPNGVVEYDRPRGKERERAVVHSWVNVSAVVHSWVSDAIIPQMIVRFHDMIPQVLSIERRYHPHQCGRTRIMRQAID